MAKCAKCDKDTSNPKFCSKSCAVSYNNIGKRRHGKPPSYCAVCNKQTNQRESRCCSNACHIKYKRENYTIPRIERGECKESLTQRKYLIEKRGNGCEYCTMSRWQGKDLVLQVDHVDGNPDNNFPNNLRLLCPNCHSLTPTYKGGNKKNPKTDSRSTKQRKAYAKKNGAPGRI